MNVRNFFVKRSFFHPTHWLMLVLVAVLLTGSGCNLFGKFAKKSVTVPALLPSVNAPTPTLIAEVNRMAGVRSLKAKVVFEFQDNSFAGTGVVEKYRNAEGTVYLQRPRQVYLTVQGPFATKIAEMTSDGESFRLAVLQGDANIRRFVVGKNSSDYSRLQEDVMNDGKQKSMRQAKAAVSAFQNLRPQHFTEALFLEPITPPSETGYSYARSEIFEEEPDTRVPNKTGGRIVRGYYILDELAPQANGVAIVKRRFWFDRYQRISLARIQYFDAQERLTADVRYGAPVMFGEANLPLPSTVELTRPYDRYRVKVTYQVPAEATVNKAYEPEVFVLRQPPELRVLDLEEELQKRGAVAKP